MSLTSHLSELRKKHETLSRQVEAEQRNPGSDSIALSEMKKRKLAIKQQIERLGQGTTH
ncbi:YdcH family protein [Jannaschia sp. 2305UL9-9]|uniref:YdcH family protein n=1 Tax=Jannaschia sp. 2305UL9-9 TaxID=3121638 RepID=UPI0035285FE8